MGGSAGLDVLFDAVSGLLALGASVHMIGHGDRNVVGLGRECNCTVCDWVNNRFKDGLFMMVDLYARKVGRYIHKLQQGRAGRGPLCFFSSRVVLSVQYRSTVLQYEYRHRKHSGFQISECILSSEFLRVGLTLPSIKILVHLYECSIPYRCTGIYCICTCTVLVTGIRNTNTSIQYTDTRRSTVAIYPVQVQYSYE